MILCHEDEGGDKLWYVTSYLIFKWWNDFDIKFELNFLCLEQINKYKNQQGRFINTGIS